MFQFPALTLAERGFSCDNVGVSPTPEADTVTFQKNLVRRAQKAARIAARIMSSG